jgi:hypothetical protein
MAKLTGYVLRTRVLPRWQPGDALDVSVRFGFPHCVLALSILEARGGGRTALLAEAIARSDEEFASLRAPVEDWSAYRNTLNHSFVARHAPDLSVHAERTSYALLIDQLWGWRNGTYEIHESVLQGYWSELKSVPLRWRYALQIPTTLLLHVILVIEPVHLPRLISKTRRRLTGSHRKP